jgi:hypothetical protein
MYMVQVSQIGAIMEATGAVKDAPVIRELLDEALMARRRKSAALYDSEPELGQEIRDTLHTIQDLLLKLIRREELIFQEQKVGLSMLREALIEARSAREIVFEELVEKPWLQKGKSKETMCNFFDMKTQNSAAYVDEVLASIKQNLDAERSD